MYYFHTIQTFSDFLLFFLACLRSSSLPLFDPDFFFFFFFSSFSILATLSSPAASRLPPVSASGAVLGLALPYLSNFPSFTRAFFFCATGPNPHLLGYVSLSIITLLIFATTP